MKYINKFSYITKRFAILILCLATILSMAVTVSAAGNNVQYDRFHTDGYSYTGNGAADIAAIALAQYQDSNGNKRSESQRNRSYYGYNNAWCAYFVYDCARAANQEAAIPYNGGYAYQVYQSVLNAGGYKVDATDVQVGDIAVFDFACSGGLQHVEVVVKVSGSTITTVGGNTGNGVVGLHKRSNYGYKENGKTIKDVTCYVHPAYSNYTDNSSSAADTANDGYVGTYRISPACAPNHRIDIKDQRSENGTLIHLWEKHEGDSQKFVLRELGDGGYRIETTYGKCLDVKGGKASSGVTVQEYEINNTDAQKWYLNYLDNGYYNIVSALDPNLCLDVAGGKANNGTRLQIYRANGTNAQMWGFSPVS